MLEIVRADRSVTENQANRKEQCVRVRAIHSEKGLQIDLVLVERDSWNLNVG